MTLHHGFDKGGNAITMDSEDADAIINVAKARVYVECELKEADVQVKYHEDTDSRASLLESTWRTYRKDLRNYVQAGAIVGAKPVRPT